MNLDKYIRNIVTATVHIDRVEESIGDTWNKSRQGLYVCRLCIELCKV